MASSEIQKTRVINELTGFIKKLLQDPKVLETSLDIARRHLENGSDSSVMSDIASPSGRSCTTPVSELASCNTEAPGSAPPTTPPATTPTSGVIQALTASCSIGAP